MTDEHFNVGEKVLAAYDFKARYDDELNIEEGDVIQLMGFTEDGDWAFGDHNGQQGWFPISYVKNIKADENLAHMFESLHLLDSPTTPSPTKIALFDHSEDEDDSSISSSTREKDGAASKRVSALIPEPIPEEQQSKSISQIRAAVSQDNIKSPMPSTIDLKKNLNNAELEMDKKKSISLIQLAPSKKRWKDEVASKLDLSTLKKEEISRQEVIYELAQTEKDYVEDLIIVREASQRHLRQYLNPRFPVSLVVY